MFCEKCGAKLNAGDKFCNECGSKADVSNTKVEGEIEIVRDSNFVGSIIGFPLYVDDEKVGTLSNGSSIKVNTTLGTHAVLVKIHGTCTIQEVILTKETPSARMEVMPVMGLWKTKPVFKNVTYK